jgi:hypothetical protein
MSGIRSRCLEVILTDLTRTMTASAASSSRWSLEIPESSHWAYYVEHMRFDQLDELRSRQRCDQKCDGVLVADERARQHAESDSVTISETLPLLAHGTG